MVAIPSVAGISTNPKSSKIDKGNRGTNKNSSSKAGCKCQGNPVFYPFTKSHAVGQPGQRIINLCLLLWGHQSLGEYLLGGHGLQRENTSSLVVACHGVLGVVRRKIHLSGWLQALVTQLMGQQVGKWNQQVGKWK